MTFVLNFLPQPELKQVTGLNGRYYYNPLTEEKFDSVTTVLQRATDLSWLEEWKRRVGVKVAEQITKAALERGTQTHHVLEDYVKGKPDYDKNASPFMKKAIRGVTKLLDEKVSVVYGIEMPVFSRHLNTAGTLDMYCQWNGVNAIVDYKTCKEIKRESDISNYFFQATAYAMMIEEMYLIKVPKIVVVMIPEFDYPYLFQKDSNELRNDVEKIFIQDRQRENQ